MLFGTHLRKEEMKDLSLSDYDMGSYYARTNRKREGLMILFKTYMQFEEIKNIQNDSQELL